MKKIIDSYSTYLINNGERPVSVASFTEGIKLKENHFYKHFSSFFQLEQKIFEAFHEETINLLLKNKEYNKYDSRTKLISYYYTFFELLTANRSLVQLLLNKPINELVKEKKLLLLKNVFQEYINQLDIEIYNFGISYLDVIHGKGIKELAWVQFMFALKFWLEDNSTEFENTDVFIEKSLNASFDLIEQSPIESIVDFGKFIFKKSLNK